MMLWSTYINLLGPFFRVKLSQLPEIYRIIENCCMTRQLIEMVKTIAYVKKIIQKRNFWKKNIILRQAILLFVKILRYFLHTNLRMNSPDIFVT